MIREVHVSLRNKQTTNLSSNEVDTDTNSLPVQWSLAAALKVKVLLGR